MQLFCRVRWIMESLLVKLGLLRERVKKNLSPDSPDDRDYDFRSARTGENIPLPPKADLSGSFSPVEDQEQLGSCTAQAIAGVLEYEQIRRTGTFTDLSRLFIYFNEREYECKVKSDSGAHLRTGMKVLKKFGACIEVLWPYNIFLFSRRPDETAYRDGINRVKVRSYMRAKGITGVREAIAEGFPVIAGIRCPLTMGQVGESGIVPDPFGPYFGGHAIVLVGYDDDRELVKFRNSWSSAWGEAGYGYLPYRFINDPERTFDLWLIDSEVRNG